MTTNRRVFASTIPFAAVALAVAVPSRAQAQDMDQQLIAQSSRLYPGAGPLGYPLHGSLGEGQVHSFTVLFEASACYSVVALAGPLAADLDVSVYDPTQHAVAHDRDHSTLATARTCARVAGPHRIDVRMTRGQGPFVANVYRLPTGAPGDGARPVQGQATPVAPVGPVGPAPTPIQPGYAPASATGPDYLSRRLLELVAQFAPGQTPTSQVYQGMLHVNQSQEVSVPLEFGRCYTFIGTGTPDGGDLDLYLLDPRGEPVAHDDDRNNNPHVRYCPRAPGLFRVEMLMGDRGGPFAMQIFAQ